MLAPAALAHSCVSILLAEFASRDSLSGDAFVLQASFSVTICPKPGIATVVYVVCTLVKPQNVRNLLGLFFLSV